MHFTLQESEFYLPAINTVHSFSPEVRSLDFLDEEKTRVLYSAGSGESAIEKSLIYSTKPDTFLKINPLDQIVNPSEPTPNNSIQINQSISNIYRLIFEGSMISVDFADIKTVLRRSGFGYSVFGNAEKSVDIATQMAFDSIEEITPTEMRKCSSLLATIRGHNISLDDFSSVGEKIHHHSLIDDKTDILLGIVREDEFTDNTEVNITFIWENL